MEPLYTEYVLNQPRALEHYHRLSETFQFDVYFPRSQILAHKSSEAWDLPSLLIKPVQRLLHYPQLLAAIVAATPESHCDKANLVEACTRMQDMAQELNARSMRQKLVHDALAGLALVNAPQARKKGSVKVGLPMSGSLGRIVKLRAWALKARERPVVDFRDGEGKEVQLMAKRLKSYQKFMAKFTKGIVEWMNVMRDFVGALDEWAKSFDRMIRLDPDALQILQALFDEWPTFCDEVEEHIQEDVLLIIASLTSMTVAPIHLFDEMQTLAPLHYDLLSFSSKSRSPSQVLEASNAYVALRGQLLTDLPILLTLLDKGMSICILRFAHIQACFYGGTRDLWIELWNRMEEDREGGVGAEETILVWQNRFRIVEDLITNLKITQKMPKYPHLTPSPSSSPFTASFPSSSPSSSPLPPSPPPPPIPSLYECRVVHGCDPPHGTGYRSLPFFTLRVDDVYEILGEAGHPSVHQDLPLYVDDGEDCLLLARNSKGDVGWALASFMLPVDL